MVKFAGVDQVETFLAHVLESRNNLSLEGLHAIEISLVTGEVQIETLAQEAIRYAGKTGDRILDHFPKQSLTHLAVVDRHPQ